MLDIRELQLIDLLDLQDGYVSPEEICDRMDIKMRTLRELVRNANLDLEKNTGSVIRIRNNHGYYLEITDRTILNKYLQEARKATMEQQYELPETQDGRVNWIIRKLLNEQDYVKAEKLADALYVSGNTFRSDLKLVREKLAKYDLLVDSKAGQGIRIVGPETSIRTCIGLWFYHADYTNSRNFESQPLGMFDHTHRYQVENILHEVMTENHYKANDIGVENLMIHIMVALFRIQNGIYLEQEVALGKEEEALEYRMAQEICRRIQDTIGIIMPETEVRYIALHLMGSRVFAETDENLIEPETLNMVRAILNDIYDVYGYDFRQDIDLYTMLSLHLQPMLKRLEGGIHIDNPLLEQVKNENPMGYELAVQASHTIETKTGKQVDASELGYLALHFQLAIARRSEQKKYRILTVCASGAGTARMLEYNVRKKFKDQLASVDHSSVWDLKNLDLDSYDLILTTVPLAVVTRTPVLKIGLFLSESDEEAMERILTHPAELDMTSYFMPELFLDHVKADSKEELLHLMCTQLVKVMDLPDDFEKLVLERESLSTTDIGLGVALPHPSRLLVTETKICAAHLDQPIYWGRQTVENVLLLAVRKDAGEDYTAFSEALFSLVNNREAMRRINADPCYETWIDEIRNLSVKKPEESIFA